MKNMIKRIFIGIFSYILIFSFSGCAKKEEKNSLVIWHWMTDRQEAFEELAGKYEKLTGIKVKFELFSPPGAYSQKIVASAQAKTLPDIFGILGEKRNIAEFIKAGHILNLTPYLEENNGRWKKSFFIKGLEVTAFKEGNIYGVEPGFYAVPIDMMNIQMVVNMKLLKKAGINNPPRTWNEFIEDLKILKENNIIGFVCGWSESWLLDCFSNNYVFNIMGKEKLLKTIKGEVPYNDEDWIKVFKLFEELRDSGGLIDGIVTKNNKESEYLFAAEKVAFSFNGSWGVNVYREMNPNLDYKVILPPPYTDKHPMRIWGGAGSSFYVNKNSPRYREAVDFLKWLTAKEQQVFLVKATNNLPSNKYAVKYIPSKLAEFARGSEYITHPNMWPYQEDTQVVEKLTRGLQGIIIGDISAKELADQITHLKSKLIEKKRK